MADASPKTRRPGRGVGLFLALFGLPFLLVGLGMSWRTLSQLHDHYRSRDWIETPATIRTLDLRVDSSGDGTSYQVICHYFYEFGGHKYEGKRVGILSGGDNVDGWQQRTHKRMERFAKNGEPIVAYVNPRDPREPLLDRELRFNILTFSLLFATVFGAAGLGVTSAGLYLRRRARLDTVADAPQDQPWLQRKDWASGILKFERGGVELVLWALAIFWNLVSWPPLMALPAEIVNNGNRKALFALPFPLVGLILLMVAVRLTLRRRRFGQSYLQMTTIPGVLGGHLRGILVLAGSLEGLDRVRVDLKCLRSYTTGSGDDRTTRTETLWSNGLDHDPAIRFGQTQIEVPLDFQIPYECRPTDRSDASDTIKWNLQASGPMPGVDLWLEFEVPVFKTSSSNPKVGESTQRIAHEEAAVASDENPLPRQIRVDTNIDGTTDYTVCCWPGLTLVLVCLVVGLLTAGVAVFAYTRVMLGEKFLLIFLIPFGLVSLLMFLVVIGCLGRYRVTLATDSIRVRRTYGLPGRTRTIQASDVSAIETKQCASAGDKKWYAIYCRTGRLRSFQLASNIPGLIPAQWLARRIEKHVSGASGKVPITIPAASDPRS